MSEAVQTLKLRKPKTELESRTFKDGAIYLFRRADYKKPTWFCRVKVPNGRGYVQASTRTTDEHQAFAFANDLFNKTLVRVAGGQEINAKKAQAAIYEYVASLEPTKDEKLSISLRIHFLKRSAPFFKNKRLAEINTAVLSDFIVWLGTNATKGKLSPNTIKRNFTDLKQFFGWCVERGYIEAPPKFPRLKGDANRRPHFDYKDWRKLARHLREFIKVKDPNVLRDRTMLVNYVLILASTGIRVGEARTLKWRDIREIAPPAGTDQQPDVALFVNGKTGPREVVSKSGDVKIYFKRILDLRMNESGKRPSGDDYVFASPEGKPIGSFKKSFASLLNSAKVEKDSHGNRRTIYSLRHTYATFRLQEGVHQYILARNMGTSTAMLEKHYGHTSNVVNAAELTKRTGGSKSRKIGAVDWLME